ncbi:hypothetical protein [Catenulispora pinistramenti]|nr:hypothetical protein [Catenulispora pinistramenti]
MDDPPDPAAGVDDEPVVAVVAISDMVRGAGVDAVEPAFVAECH